jgi:hypothetical protein
MMCRESKRKDGIRGRGIKHVILSLLKLLGKCRAPCTALLWLSEQSVCEGNGRKHLPMHMNGTERWNERPQR